MDFATDMDDEISKATISRSARSNLHLILPWHPLQTIKMGTLFHSQKLDDPWATNSPFRELSLATAPVIVRREDGTEGSFKSHSSSSASSTHDHLSLGLGMGVGVPFLAEVSVSGTYDSDAMENKDTNKTSIRSSVRAGIVAFARQPRLTNEAIITIKYNGGLPAFHERYGDYYVSGYRLGGDTQMMISGSSSSKKVLEKFGVTVKVEVLFFEASTAYAEDFETYEAKRALNLIGYDTLDHQSWKFSTNGKGSAAVELQRQAAEIISQSQSLDMRISNKLDELSIEDGDHLTFDECRKLTEAGLVVELVLSPVGTLREVIEWKIQDNII